MKAMMVLVFCLAAGVPCVAQKVPGGYTPQQLEALNARDFQQHPEHAYLSPEFGGFVRDILVMIDSQKVDKPTPQRLTDAEKSLYDGQRLWGEQMISMFLSLYELQGAIDVMNSMTPIGQWEPPILADRQACSKAIRRALDANKAPAWIHACDRLR